MSLSCDVRVSVYLSVCATPLRSQLCQSLNFYVYLLVKYHRFKNTSPNYQNFYYYKLRMSFGLTVYICL